MAAAIPLSPAAVFPQGACLAPSTGSARPGTSAAHPARKPPISAGYIVLAILAALALVCAAEIASYFRLGSATQALRASVMDSVPGNWHKRFAVNIGWLTVAAVRYGSQFFKLPPEPRAVLDAVRGAEVGIYKLDERNGLANYPALFASSDKAMKRRGWQRLVGVAKGRECVAVYAPQKMRSLSRAAVCVLVLNDRDLVIASGRANLQPLLDLATQHLQADSTFERLDRSLHL